MTKSLENFRIIDTTLVPPGPGQGPNARVKVTGDLVPEFDLPLDTTLFLVSALIRAVEGAIGTPIDRSKL